MIKSVYEATGQTTDTHLCWLNLEHAKVAYNWNVFPEMLKDMFTMIILLPICPCF